MFENMHDWMSWLLNNAAVYLLPFLAVLALLVFVHEWGHYIVARLCGIKVEKFSIGFGKKIASWTDKAGTRWQVAILPLGGFVQMFGDVDAASGGHSPMVKQADGTERPMTEAELGQAFFAKPLWARAAVVAAGPAINFLFALVLLTGIYASVGRVVVPPVVGAVMSQSAAQEAGFAPQDRVLSINGEATNSFGDIQRFVTVSLNQPLDVVVERNGAQVALSGVTPKLDKVTDRFGFSHTRGLLGLLGSGVAISVDDIARVDGQSGDVRALLLGKVGQDVELAMKAPEGAADATSGGLIIHISADLNADFIAGEGEGARTLILASSQNDDVQALPFASAFVEAGREVWFVTAGTFQALGQMIAGTRSAQELGGIIRIGAVAGDAAKQGIVALLTLAALLSVNLGLINLFPIPMLDGGHLLFYALEAIKGRPVPERVQDAALRFGFVVLIALMAFANINDLIQINR